MEQVIKYRQLSRVLTKGDLKVFGIGNECCMKIKESSLWKCGSLSPMILSESHLAEMAESIEALSLLEAPRK
jgi:hypothetical protein